MDNTKTTQDIDWEKRFATQDAKLKKDLQSGKKKVNTEPRFICVGCE